MLRLIKSIATTSFIFNDSTLTLTARFWKMNFDLLP